MLEGLAVEVVVDDVVLDAVHAEVQQPGEDRLGPLVDEKLLQVVVAQGGVLHINFADDPHLDLLLPVALNGGEVVQDGPVVFLHLQKGL